MWFSIHVQAVKHVILPHSPSWVTHSSWRGLQDVAFILMLLLLPLYSVLLADGLAPYFPKKALGIIRKGHAHSPHWALTKLLNLCWVLFPFLRHSPSSGPTPTQAADSTSLASFRDLLLSFALLSSASVGTRCHDLYWSSAILKIKFFLDPLIFSVNLWWPWEHASRSPTKGVFLTEDPNCWAWNLSPALAVSQCLLHIAPHQSVAGTLIQIPSW